jgi:hypothetical protein
MKAQQRLNGASYGPETMKVITQAFDAAWAEIANEVEDNRVAIEANRLKLADAVLANAKDDSRDPEALKNAALFAFVRDGGKR